MSSNPLREFIRMESAGGILLLLAAVLAMVVANSPLADLYGALLQTTVEVQVGALEIRKPLLLWINDGLMAVFFFLIGLEIKREVMEGRVIVIFASHFTRRRCIGWNASAGLLSMPG